MVSIRYLHHGLLSFSIFTICSWCEGHEVTKTLSKAFVQISLAFVNELHSEISHSEMSISGTRKVVAWVTSWERLPKFTPTQIRATEQYIQMLQQVPLWKISSEDRRSMVKIMLEFLTLLNK
ncbi:hypothetical protein GNI_086300 [Gregarina niphandrodes]|uniref:Transmembrane protein n=1 Tax=Gregarina niphandrodes TaxID=110365 RepID=A0A023B607_GRENI|nr:hypothetical protein GNI_086300 [Gregarina niphandrodes]EZG63928.1 hypothetical protein GNI_086300 [Gregarina niphandrodes]|eukprot:XP_011130653.1 hypothetical protein GNI_086300 [Gregarina niphandrodes]